MRYTCNNKGCTLDLKLSEPGVCPVNNAALTPWSQPGLRIVDNDASGCLLQPENAKRVQEQLFAFLKGAQFSVKKFVPTSHRGLFDCTYAPSTGRIDVTVTIYCNYTMVEDTRRRDLEKTAPTTEMRKGWQEMTDWSLSEKLAFEKEAQQAVSSAWDVSHILVCDKPGWPLLKVAPYFNLEFVTSKSGAAIIADVIKIPTIDPTFFDCGGTRVGLQQILTGNETCVSKAALTSQSGKPVAMASENLGLQKGQTINYNVMAHEFGHMIGLPDEYEKVTRSSAGKPEDQAKAIHLEGARTLASRARVRCPEFGEFTTSLMSRGTVVLPYHLITVWEALCLMTKGHITPSEWTIV